jgi:hypothetical protein
MARGMYALGPFLFVFEVQQASSHSVNNQSPTRNIYPAAGITATLEAKHDKRCHQTMNTWQNKWEVGV